MGVKISMRPCGKWRRTFANVGLLANGYDKSGCLSFEGLFMRTSSPKAVQFYVHNFANRNSRDISYNGSRLREETIVPVDE